MTIKKRKSNAPDLRGVIYFDETGKRQITREEFTKPVPVEVTVQEMTSYLSRLTAWMNGVEPAEVLQ